MIYIVTVEQRHEITDRGMFYGMSHSTSLISAHSYWQSASRAAVDEALEMGCSFAKGAWDHDDNIWKLPLMASDPEEDVWMQITRMELS